MGAIGFWDLVRVKLHLASPALQARYQDAVWRGIRPSPAALALQKTVFATGILLLAMGGTYLCLPLAFLGWAGTELMRQEAASAWQASQTGNPAFKTGNPALTVSRTGPPRTDKQLLELLTPAAREEVQRRHDRWQKIYGDGTYRAELKPWALEAALQSYLGELMLGRTTELPSVWLSRLTPERIGAFADRAESTGWRSLQFSMDNPQYYLYQYRPSPGDGDFANRAWGALDGDGMTSSFQMVGQVEPGQARTVPALSETSPEE